jgi:hypothetical protein
MVYQAAGIMKIYYFSLPRKGVNADVLDMFLCKSTIANVVIKFLTRLPRIVFRLLVIVNALPAYDSLGCHYTLSLAFDVNHLVLD